MHWTRRLSAMSSKHTSLAAKRARRPLRVRQFLALSLAAVIRQLHGHAKDWDGALFGAPGVIDNALTGRVLSEVEELRGEQRCHAEMKISASSSEIGRAKRNCGKPAITQATSNPTLR